MSLDTVASPQPATDSSTAQTDVTTTHTRTVIVRCEPITSFHGDWRSSENPQEFIKSLNRLFRALGIKDDAERVEAFVDYLFAGSVADDWYRKLRASEVVSTWDSLVNFFNEQWPPIQRAFQTSSDYQRELLELELTDADLGKTVTVGGQDVWSHVAWADRAWQLARIAKIEDSDWLTWIVREQLPGAVRDQLKGSYKDWHTFISDVKRIKHTRLTNRSFTTQTRRRRAHGVGG